MKTMLIADDHPDYARLKRYAIAYGAVIAMDEEDADLIVQTNRQAGNDKTVTADWVFECIKADRLVDKF